MIQNKDTTGNILFLSNFKIGSVTFQENFKNQVLSKGKTASFLFKNTVFFVFGFFEVQEKVVLFFLVIVKVIFLFFILTKQESKTNQKTNKGKEKQILC